MIHAARNSKTPNALRSYWLKLALGVLVINLTVLTLAGWTLETSRRNYERQAGQTTQNLSYVLKLTFVGLIERIDVAMLALVTESENQLAHGGFDEDKLRTYARRQKSLLSILEDISITGSDGDVVAGALIEPGRQVNLSDRDYFRKLRDNPKAGLVLSGPVESRITGKWVVVLARRINHGDGAFGGIVASPISVERLLSILTAVDVGKMGHVSLRDEHMALIARFPNTEVWEKARGSQSLSLETLQLLRERPDVEVATYDNAAAVDHVPRRLTIRHLTPYPLYMFVALAKDEYLARWRSEFTSTSILAALFTLLTLWSASLAYGQHRREVDELENLRHRGETLEALVASRTASLALACDTAETANRAKSLFLASMSHELRTPLNAILGFAELLHRNPDLTEDARQSVEVINRSGVHLLSMINDILDLSKIEAGRVEVHLESFELPQVFEEITAMLRVRAVEKGLTLTLDLDPTILRHIQTDLGKLRQLLINIIGNSIKFTAQGGIVIHARTFDVDETADFARLEIEVEDTGVGISPEHLKRIFEPFASFVSDANNPGTGLGLAISRGFVSLLGGTITVNSTLDVGSVFRIELPVKRAFASTNAVTTTSERHAVGIEPGQDEYRLLIVDDNAANVALLLGVLSNVGLSARVAVNGLEAVNLATEYRPHLIWMDLRMPELNGYDATKRIRLLPHGSAIRIVALTASAFKDQDSRFIEAGGDEVMHKPYHDYQIYDCLERHLGIRFRYEDQSDTKKATEPATVAITSVPEDVRRQLLVAASLLDKGEVIRLAGGLEPEHAMVTEWLRSRAMAYDFEAIEGLLSRPEQI